MSIKFISTICYICFVVAGCNQPNTVTQPDLESVKKAVIETDLAFSKYSIDSGTAKSFAVYAAKDLIRINNRAMPTIGINELIKEAQQEKKEDPRLSWKPLKVEVSSSGDMASAYGKWQFTVKNKSNQDTTIHGNYITVWKKQADGKWKFIMDGGGATPAEVADNLVLSK